MDKKNKTRKLILISSAIVILGVAGYFGYKWWKNRSAKKEEETDKDNKDSTDYSGGAVSVGTSTSTNPFKTSEDLKKFQQWVINVKKDSTILGSSGADGIWGKKSEAAWNKYGSEYQNKTGVMTSSKTMLKMTAVSKIKTLGGTPDIPKDEIYYDVGKVLGYVAFTKPDGTGTTIVKTDSRQDYIVKRGASAILDTANYYWKYWDTNLNTFRYIILKKEDVTPTSNLNKKVKLTELHS